jgi:hypothetical protein
VSAKDQDALCQSLLWTYVDDEDLISDETVRNRLLKLHFKICSLVREVTFPQWYNEAEFAELEDDFTFLAVECNWLQDLLESHGELTGNGFDIIKFHDFLSIPSIMRELGCIMAADTSTMEMRMRELKLHDKFVKKSRRDKGHRTVFLRAIARDLDDAYQAWKDALLKKESLGRNSIADTSDSTNTEPAITPSTNSDSEGSSTEDEYTFHNKAETTRTSTRKVGAWSETCYVLDRGVNGPTLDTSLLVTHFPEITDIKDGVHVFHNRELIRHEDPTSLKVSNMYLLPGHCVELVDGQYAQVILPNVEVSAMYGIEGTTALLTLFKFVDPASNFGKHPILPVPFLQRAHTAYMPLANVKRRVHIYPKWRPGPNGTASVKFNVHFFVNPFVFKVRRGPSHPRVCVSCPKNGCSGRAPMPKAPEKLTSCSLCSYRFTWF